MEKALWFLIVILILNAFNAQARSPRKLKSGRRVVGGAAADVHNFPWQVGLFQGIDEFFCGGSIVSAYFVLTAAHCFAKVNKQLHVRYGSSRVERGRSSRVSYVFKHPEYRGVQRFWADDIAVLQLESAIAFSDVANAISLSTTTPGAGDIASVSGWGSKSYPDGPISYDLQAASLNIIDWQDCFNSIRYLQPKMICAKTAGVGICTGDSGGALTVNNKQVGIASFRHSIEHCGDLYSPEVYTSVAQYKEFIDEKTQNNAHWDYEIHP